MRLIQNKPLFIIVFGSMVYTVAVNLFVYIAHSLEANMAILQCQLTIYVKFLTLRSMLGYKFTCTASHLCTGCLHTSVTLTKGSNNVNTILTRN